MNSFQALIKREFWEHKRAILTTPLVLCAVFAVLILITSAAGETIDFENGHQISLSNHLPQAVEQFESISEQTREKWMSGILYSPVVLFGLVSLIVSLFFALGALYDERKDKSILFWKSLPISDTQTVISKFVAISVLTPLVYASVVVIFQIILMFYATILSWIGGSSGVLIWTSVNLFGVIVSTFSTVLLASLWLAPIWSWALLASAWAKKAPFLWAILPVLLLAYAEYMVFGGKKFIAMFSSRILEGLAIQNLNLNQLFGEGSSDLDIESVWHVPLMSEFWVGLLVATVFIAAAIYTRRFRDDT